jgi:signal transduction histidine kinase
VPPPNENYMKPVEADNRGTADNFETAALAHEISGRVASISMFIQEIALREGQQASTFLEERLRRLGRVAAELQQIVDAIRRMADDTPPVRESVDVATLATALARSATERTTKFRRTTVVVQSGIEVMGSPGEVAILLDNLIGNALKFSASRTAPIIRVTSESQPDQTIVHVSDNGVGIAREDECRIFEPFAKCHSGFDGTGLGLAIAKRIVERHGGKIWATGAVGLGTTVSFHL